MGSLTTTTTVLLAGSIALAGTAAAQASSALPAQAGTAVATLAVRPPITYDPIRYSAKRKRQMAAYAWRHYGIRTSAFSAPKQVILHYTVSPNYSSVHNWFNANSKSPGNGGTRKESPGACTHFVIGKNGTIYQQVPLDVMCRHVVGLNNVAIGIEFVEMRSASNILRRPKQTAAGLALVRWLQSTYGIATSDVIGHSMANQSRFFTDNQGWFNDHDDWHRSQVRTFRRQL
jgi:hypothetical protein